MSYILSNFDEVSRTAGFEDMGRTNVELGEGMHCTYLPCVLCFCACAILWNHCPRFYYIVLHQKGSSNIDRAL